jgi:transposase
MLAAAATKVVEAAAPERLIAGGLATPALLAQVMVSKYCDHTPLYRQSQIFARHGVDLGRSTHRMGRRRMLVAGSAA